MFLSQETVTDTFFFEPCEVPALFPFTNFSCEGSFSFGKSWKCLFADRLKCEHRHFDMATSVGLVSYILEDLGPHGELLTKQTSFLMQRYAQLAKIASWNFTSLFSPAAIRLQAPTNRTCAALGHFQTICLYANSGQIESVYNGRSDHGWSARCQQFAVIMYIIHIQLFSANLDESWKWPWGPSNNWNSGESWKIPISHTHARTHAHKLKWWNANLCYIHHFASQK